MAYPGEFVKWLQDEMDKRGWSISEFARKSGITDPHLGRILRGDRKAGNDAANAIARAFELPPEVVFRKAGLLPPTKDELDELEKEWQHLFDLAQTDEERQELIERARFELTRIRERRGDYDVGS